MVAGMRAEIPYRSSGEGPWSQVSNSDLTRSKQQIALIHRLSVLGMALFCIAVLANNLVDPDLWGHEKYGRDLIIDRRLPETATHTYTAFTHR